jgi:hypothetical protein
MSTNPTVTVDAVDLYTVMAVLGLANELLVKNLGMPPVPCEAEGNRLLEALETPGVDEAVQAKVDTDLGFASLMALVDVVVAAKIDDLLGDLLGSKSEPKGFIDITLA